MPDKELIEYFIRHTDSRFDEMRLEIKKLHERFYFIYGAVAVIVVVMEFMFQGAMTFWKH